MFLQILLRKRTPLGLGLHICMLRKRAPLGLHICMLRERAPLGLALHVCMLRKRVPLGLLVCMLRERAPHNGFKRPKVANKTGRGCVSCGRFLGRRGDCNRP